MPYTIQLEEKGIRWVFSGEVNDQDILSCYTDFFNKELYRDFHYGIVDYLAVTQYNVSSDTVIKIAQMDEAASPGGGP